MSLSRPSRITAETAETLAIQALTFIAGDGERLGRFLAATGIGPADIRAVAREPRFLAGILDHLESDEALLLAFAAEAGIDPTDVGHARTALDPRPPRSGAR